MLVLFSTLFFMPILPLDAGGGVGPPACPNERACDVGVKFEEQGTPRTCGVGISLFGFDLSIGGDECYPMRLTYPAHQECHGKRNVGTYCAVEQVQPVSVEHCDCSRAAVLGTGFTLPDCVCTAAGTLGTLTDYKTENCAPPPVQGGGSSTGGRS
ncbi:MAG: hypothetical protein IPJ77_11670 [Planctomycetes bacterium]|nr:hypothetical protein [Planctomycetota bacterium]